jgi:hypothetical protein
LGDGRLLLASDLARILRVYLRVVEELPPDTEAGSLDANGHVHFAPDIGRKLRAARAAVQDLERVRKAEEG